MDLTDEKPGQEWQERLQIGTAYYKSGQKVLQIGADITN